MLNTYLNDNVTVPYPFFGDVALPFACSCIAGLGICIKGEPLAGPLYAASVTIGQTSVYIVIAYTDNGSEKILGTLFADSARADRTGLLVPGDSDKQASGFLLLGTIPDTSIGQYNGRYTIDPSCVSYMPTTRYGHYDTLVINDIEYSVGQLLEINANGLLALSGGTLLQGTEESDTQDLFAFSNTSSYDTRVSSINGIDTEFNGTSGTLVISGGQSVAVEVQSAGTATGSVIVVSVNGGPAFPNCYPTGDDAATVTPISIP